MLSLLCSLNTWIYDVFFFCLCEPPTLVWWSDCTSHTLPGPAAWSCTSSPTLVCQSVSHRLSHENNYLLGNVYSQAWGALSAILSHELSWPCWTLVLFIVRGNGDCGSGAMVSIGGSAWAREFELCCKELRFLDHIKCWRTLFGFTLGSISIDW